VCTVTGREVLILARGGCTLLSISNSFYQVEQSLNVFPSAQYYFGEPEGERGVLIFEKETVD